MTPTMVADSLHNLLSSQAKRVYVVIFNPDVQRVLLVRQRHAHQRNQVSWGFPGGHREPAETAMAAAAREVYEETGLQLQTESLVPILDTEQGTLFYYYEDTTPDWNTLHQSAQARTDVREIDAWWWGSWHDVIHEDVLPMVGTVMQHIWSLLD